MPRFLRSTCAFLLMLGLLPAAEAWMTDLEAAKTQAAEGDKDLLVDFTGSDWCGWCIRLKEEVFHQQGFAPVSEHFVLVELDYPNAKPQSEEVKERNAALAQTYEIEGYPTILLMDAQGRAYAKTGYRPGGPEAYLAHLEELRANKAQRDALLEQAQAAEGAAKADLLAQALEVIGDAPTAGYEAEVAHILAEGSPELRLQFEIPGKLKEVMTSLRSEDLASARTQIDEILAMDGLSGELKQEALFFSAMVHFTQDQSDKLGTIKILKDALEAAPDGELAPQIHNAVENLAQAAAAESAGETSD